MTREMEAAIDALLRQPLFGMGPEQRERTLLPLFRERIRQAAAACPPYQRYVASWPIRLERAARDHVFEVERFYPLYPEVVDSSIMTAARVEAQLRRTTVSNA